MDGALIRCLLNARTEEIAMHKIFVSADQVRKNDTLCYSSPRREIRVERVSRSLGGKIGLHANSDAKSVFYNPSDRVRIMTRATLEATP